MSSLTTPPAKILLSSTTKVSLHDRFTKLAKTKTVFESKGNDRVGRGGVVKKFGNIGPASAKNRSLAMQMASRPTVQAALRIKNKVIKQKIGQVQAIARLGNRLNRSGNRVGLINNNNAPGVRYRIRTRPPRRNAGIDPSRLSVGGAPFFKKNNLAKRLSGGNINNINNRVRRVGARNNNNNNNGRFKVNRSFNKNNGSINKSPNKGNNKRFNTKRIGNLNNSQNFRRNNNNNNNQNRRINRMQQQQQQQQKPKTRENLDMDLDQYMAKSKSHLDADLDTYMAQSNSGAN